MGWTLFLGVAIRSEAPRNDGPRGELPPRGYFRFAPSDFAEILYKNFLSEILEIFAPL